MANTTDTYSLLITSEHRDKPLFMAVVKALAQGPVDIQAIEAAFPTDYDLDVAAGVQLDAVGKWVGISRNLQVQLANVYFSWDDTPLLGWDSGSWKGDFDPTTGIVSLPDDAYRGLIRAKIAANQWDGSIGGAQAIWDMVFAGAQTIILQDNQDMSMVIAFFGPPLTAIQQALLTGGYFPLKPAGVRINFYGVPANTGPLFAWDADVSSTTLAGWDSGSWVQEISPP